MERVELVLPSLELEAADSDNLASRKIIESNGGRLSSEGLSAREHKLVARYWTDC
jgi:predicted acetyltransferase